MKFRIGTRRSPLAQWQANQVKAYFDQNGIDSDLIPIDSQGDINLKQPLYTLGITGIFTKSLDIALLNNQVDLAVHSLKDVPTRLPEGIELICFLERGNPKDYLIHKPYFFDKSHRNLASGSLRRKAFWLNHFPQDRVQDLRGNLSKRLARLAEDNLDGVIMAGAGIERSEMQAEIESKGYVISPLDWMIPAPAQGAIAITATHEFEQLEALNHQPTAWEVIVEREFLQLLEGGCTAPIGAKATIQEERILFEATVLSLDGSQKLEYTNTFPLSNLSNIAQVSANAIFEQGGHELIARNRKLIKNMQN